MYKRNVMMIFSGFSGAHTDGTRSYARGENQRAGGGDPRGAIP